MGRRGNCGRRTNRVMSRRASRGRRILWLSLAVSLGIHLVAARMGLMPSVLSIFGEVGRREPVPNSEGMQVLPLASPRPPAASPELPPELVPDATGERMLEEPSLAAPDLDPGPGEGPIVEAGGGAFSRAPVPLTVPWLRYPPDAIEDRVSGVVVLRVRVGTDGRVEDVTVIKGLRPDCDGAAVDAAKRLIFEPAREAGRSVAAWTEVEIEFDLGKS